jgi:hypothetical protein
MAQPKLVLKFRRQGSGQSVVKAVARIRIDGTGLRAIDPETGISEALDVANIEELTIDSIRTQGPRRLVA